MIHEWFDIGMTDPLPQEASHGQNTFCEFETQNQFVYPPERLKNEPGPPRCIYLPSRELLWKMMRSAIDITDADDLWFSANQKARQTTKKKNMLMKNLKKNLKTKIKI